MTPTLPRAFYDRDTVTVAREALGKIVVRETAAVRLSGTIVETEAYVTGDAASHAFRGQTPRNAAMFGAAGCAYVYFTYGAHFMLNLVTGPEGCGEAVLVRALEPLEGMATMRRNRGVMETVPDSRLLAGPGRLTRALGITREQFDGADLTDPASGLYLIDAPLPALPDIAAATRIGITKEADRLYRFYVVSSASISRR